ncbi:MAG TPA: 50S ribosomal protein L30 [Candidatus Eisenbacteria bacterium]|nr:50S ribosomal protein L30 [Candidatus Eisenbacteria bacterium]
MAKKLKVTQRRSAIDLDFRQKRTIRALGIRRLNVPVLHDDTPQVRGMIYKVRHLLEVDEIE